MRQGPDANSTAGLGRALRVPRPFQDSYAVSLAVAITALVPYIVVSTASILYQDQVMQATGASRTGIELITGLGEAGYAFGALIGGDLAQRFRQRSMFLLCEALFTLGAVLAAVAGDPILYGIGMTLLGLSTGVLLIVALPPVIQRFPPERMPITAAAVNIGFFGGATIGPLVGGMVAAGHAWRWFHGGLAGIGLVVFAVALLTLPDREPPNRDLPFDRSGIALGFVATVLLFGAAGELSGHGFASLRFIVPLAVGACCFLMLLLTEYHKEEPLSPVKLMWNTYPVVGTLVASIGGAAFITFVELAIQLLRQVGHEAPLAAGLVFWPQVIGVLVTATLLGLLFRTRFLPLLILAGMLALVAGGVLLLKVDPPGSRGVMLAAAGLLGLGAGATVSPGLYLASLSLPSGMLGRTFALVELVRSVADYLMAPIMRQVAQVISGHAPLTVGGLHQAIWIVLLITGASTLFGLALYLAGDGLPRPDLRKWLKEGGAAIDSPRLGARLRPAARRPAPASHH